jgi:hypothetical protein
MAGGVCFLQATFLIIDYWIINYCEQRLGLLVC